jgi:5-aminopentanamidase
MRLACVQTDVVHGDPQANLARIAAHAKTLREKGVDLVVFPECAVTGYGARDLDEARAIAIAPETLDPLAALEVGVLVGTLQREGERVYNVATLFLPDGTRHEYRKTHLPFMGVDRFCSLGDRLAPVDTPWGRLGILVCFDLRFPEAARTLALGGAELILVPTNWPEGAVVSADHIALARAAENRVFVATCNRVGEERGFRFCGRSKIVGIDGEILAAAGGDATVLVADLDLALARQKRRIVTPGEYETDVFARRPELYRVENHTDAPNRPS